MWNIPLRTMLVVLSHRHMSLAFPLTGIYAQQAREKGLFEGKRTDLKQLSQLVYYS